MVRNVLASFVTLIVTVFLVGCAKTEPAPRSDMPLKLGKSRGAGEASLEDPTVVKKSETKIDAKADKDPGVDKKTETKDPGVEKKSETKTDAKADKKDK